MGFDVSGLSTGSHHNVRELLGHVFLTKVDVLDSVVILDTAQLSKFESETTHRGRTVDIIDVDGGYDILTRKVMITR